MTLQFVFSDPKAGPQWRAQMQRKIRRIARAATLGARDAAKDIEAQGRLKIGTVGRFGPRWQRGLHAEAFPKSGFVINARIDVYHTEPGARVHEYGGLIQGKPLLWLPLTFANVKQRAAEYGKQHGLFRVDRKGGKKPLLLSKRDRKPKFVGVSQVRIPARWGIRTISKDVMSRFAIYYSRNLVQNV
jgi:hypothetical protein